MGMIDPLTPREIEILEHIVQGSRRREVACRLGMSINTVKWHLSNAYSKMGVRCIGEVVLMLGIGAEPASVGERLREQSGDRREGWSLRRRLARS
jgi:DNA-binding CsgD family transcriptional regulator